MTRSGRLKLSIFVVIGALLCCYAPAHADYDWGPFSVSGFYELIGNFSDGHVNPNNLGWPENRAQIGFPLVPVFPERNGLRHTDGHPYFNYFGQDAYLRIQGNFSDEFSMYIEPRLWLDLTKAADRDYIQYESAPADYVGDGWLARGGGKDFKAELWQGYFDYRKGNLWVRAGKQTVAWGEDIAFRILDQICPLDLSEWFFFGRGFEEFDRQRIPEWLLRADYTIQTEAIPDLTLEGILSPGTWTPTILPQQGAAYNPVPSVLDYSEKVRMGRPIAGARLTGTYKDIEFSLNALTRPQNGGTGTTVNSPLFPKGPLSPQLIADNNGGIPLLFFPPTSIPALFRIRIKGQHPRFWLFGGSANYAWDRFGAILRTEAAVIPDQTFTKTYAPFSSVKLVDRPQVLLFADIDRPTYLIPNEDSMSISLSFLETYTTGHTHGVQTTGSQIDPAVQDVVLFLQQPLFRKRIELELLQVWDTSDGHWIQPGVHWEIGDHYRVDVFYNTFGGAKSSRFPGAFWWCDGVWSRVTVGF
jgi:Protein of unknown function (DUF1302)